MPHAAPDQPPWPRAMIFDLDGTLIDSAPDIAAAVSVVLAPRGIDVDAREVRRYIGNGSRRLIADLLAARDQPVDDAELDALDRDFKTQYHARPCEWTRCYDGVVEMLADQQAAGRRLAICTNKPQPVAERVLDRLALRARIDVLIGAGDYPLKPDPAPLRACLATLSVEARDAVYIGDMAVDRAAGHAAGLSVVLARFGYAGDAVDRLGAEATFSRWADWPAIRAELAGGR